jgi:hypothetical protein
MRNALLAAMLAATVACGAYQFPGPGNGSGTVSGQVIATFCAPVGPAVQPCILPGPAPASDCVPKNPIGPACGGRPIPGLELFFTKGNTTHSAKTDAAGNYSIELPSGTWSVNTHSIMRIINGPQSLVVRAGAGIVANYVVDTGIRAAAQTGSATGAPTPVHQ